MRIAVVTAADGAGWESALLTELARPVATAAASPDIEIARRCVDVIELLAVAASGQAVAALVDAQLRRLDAAAVERLSASGVAVVGVAAPGSEADQQRLRAAGIGYLVPADSAAAVFSSVVANAVADLSAGGASGRGFGDPSEAVPGLPHQLGEEPAEGGVVADPWGTDWPADSAGGPVPVRRGSVIAVWGPTGAPGRTLTAVTLADELSRLGASSLLIDADVYGGVTASMFGLLDESPGLVAACRQAQAHRLDIAGLAALCWQIGPELRVLTGIVRADRWPELRAGAVETVLEVSRELAAFTVLDLGFALETDEELSYDTMAPRRNGATLAALDAADLVLAVGSADPIGMQRLVRGLTELREAGIDAPTWVVLNRVRSSSVPGDPGAELEAALKRFAGRSPAAQLPYDRSAADQAAVTGKTLAEAAPNSPLRRAFTELAVAISGAPGPHRTRRARLTLRALRRR